MDLEDRNAMLILYSLKPKGLAEGFYYFSREKRGKTIVAQPIIGFTLQNPNI